MKIDSTTPVDDLLKALDTVEAACGTLEEYDAALEQKAAAYAELRRRDNELKRLRPVADAAVAWEYARRTRGAGDPHEARDRLLGAALAYANEYARAQAQTS